MTGFFGRDPSQARSLLAGVGVRILRTDHPGRDAVLREVLGEATDERGRIVAEPPADEAAAATGMGAWHRNSVNEFHTVLDGEGIVEFVTAEGRVPVLLTGGDIMAVERAEHRYRPLTRQGWILRFAGPANGGLESTDTGRADAPWPGHAE